MEKRREICCEREISQKDDYDIALSHRCLHLKSSNLLSSSVMSSSSSFSILFLYLTLQISLLFHIWFVVFSSVSCRVRAS